MRGAVKYFGDYYRLQIDKQIYPQLRSTVIDFPSAVSVARGYVDEAGLGTLSS